MPTLSPISNERRWTIREMAQQAGVDIFYPLWFSDEFPAHPQHRLCFAVEKQGHLLMVALQHSYLRSFFESEFRRFMVTAELISEHGTNSDFYISTYVMILKNGDELKEKYAAEAECFRRARVQFGNVRLTNYQTIRTS